MASTRQATWNRVALAAMLVVAVAFVVAWFAVNSSRACTPEARQAALKSDTSQVLAGGMSIDEAVNRQAARNAQCD